MRAYIPIIIIIVLPELLSSVRVNQLPSDVFKSKTKVELSPIIITCKLSEIIVVSAPIVDPGAQYFLYKPNGEVIKIDFRDGHLKIKSKNRTVFDDELYNDISVKYMKNSWKVVISEKTNYKVFHRADILDPDVAIETQANEFMIGPLGEDDHGNWVLSIFYMDIDDQWIEMFQVITVEIFDEVPTSPHNPHLKLGQTLDLSFAYPIKGLKSCELIAPRSTFDRFYNRSQNNLDRCGYTVPNITKEDQGLWRIVGVARIIYESETHLKVDDKT